MRWVGLAVGSIPTPLTPGSLHCSDKSIMDAKLCTPSPASTSITPKSIELPGHPNIRNLEIIATSKFGIHVESVLRATSQRLYIYWNPKTLKSQHLWGKHLNFLRFFLFSVGTRADRFTMPHPTDELGRYAVK